MNIVATLVYGDSTGEAVACISHPMAQVEYVREVTTDAVDKRQGEMCQSDEFGDKVVWMIIHVPSCRSTERN
jgi:hypothetical protein